MLVVKPSLSHIYIGLIIIGANVRKGEGSTGDIVLKLNIDKKFFNKKLQLNNKR